MAGDVAVVRVEDVPPGQLMEIEVAGRRLVLANVEGRFFAVDANCPHMGTSLALGSLKGNVVTCFAHLWQMDVATGEILYPPLAYAVPGARMRTYPVRVDGTDVLVEGFE